jgi:hypothetical protein
LPNNIKRTFFIEKNQNKSDDQDEGGRKYNRKAKIEGKNIP